MPWQVASAQSDLVMQWKNVNGSTFQGEGTLPFSFLNPFSVRVRSNFFPIRADPMLEDLHKLGKQTGNYKVVCP